jgi:hypothetical protein
MDQARAIQSAHVRHIRELPFTLLKGRTTGIRYRLSDRYFVPRTEVKSTDELKHGIFEQLQVKAGI